MHWKDALRVSWKIMRSMYASSPSFRRVNFKLTYLLQIDALSELFVAWDDAIIDAENRVAKMERDKEERRRLGLDL